MGAFELATILLVAAVALAAVGVLLFVGALLLVVLFRFRPGRAPVSPTAQAIVRPGARAAPPVPPISMGATRPASYFDDDTREPSATTVNMDGANRLRGAGDADHDEHTELFSMSEVDAELMAGGVMEDFSTPGARIPRSLPKR